MEGRAVVPIRDEAKAKIIVTRAERTKDENPVLLYPEIDTYHAVVNRMKHGQAAWE